MNTVDNMFQSVNSLPMLPKVVSEVIQALQDDDLDLRDLVHKIDHDQVISAKVLRLANSSYYGVSRKINTMEDAVSLIGVNSLRTLVVASGVTGAFSSVPNLDMKQFWRHSLVTASVVRQIARELKQPTEVAYIAALMHSIGQLLINQVFPVAGAEIEAMCRGLSVIERKAVENSTLGIDHCQIGEELAKRWSFPEEIQRVIRYYADPLNPAACSLAPVVYMAAHISFGLESGEDAQHIAETLNLDIAKALKIEPAGWPEKIESYREFIKEAESFI